jgi:hypothetical protein
MKLINQCTYLSKKILFILFVFLCNLQLLNAQQKFVEVTATDTILAEATTFVYKLIANPAFETTSPDTSSNFKNAEDYYAQTKRNNENNKKYFDSVIAVLRNRKFIFLQHSINNNFAISQSTDQIYSEEIIINSFDSLSLLYDQLKDQKRINGFVTVAKAKNESGYQNILYKKIIDQAYKKARTIAQCSKQKIGSIISVTENKASVGGWTVYPPLSALGDSEIPGHTNIQSGNEILPAKLYSISASFTIRFSVE